MTDDSLTALVESSFLTEHLVESCSVRFLIVYFQCIRKYKDYTFDYDDLAV